MDGESQGIFLECGLRLDSQPHILLPQFLSSALFFFFFGVGVQGRSHSLSCFRLQHRVAASKTAADRQLWALVGKHLPRKCSLCTILSFSCCQHSMLKPQYFISSKHRSRHFAKEPCLLPVLGSEYLFASCSSPLPCNL